MQSVWTYFIAWLLQKPSTLPLSKYTCLEMIYEVEKDVKPPLFIHPVFSTLLRADKSGACKSKVANLFLPVAPPVESGFGTGLFHLHNRFSLGT